MLILRDVSRSYGRDSLAVHAVRSVTLSVVPGELVAVAGPSGSGKSTILNIVGLCDAPSSGTVSFGGEQINFHNQAALTALRRSKIGYVFQFQNLIPHLTALENVTLPLLLNGHSLSGARKVARSLLVELGLENRVTSFPAQLSGGEAQRVGLARAIIHRPPLIVADEPTASLDTASGEIVLGYLEKFARDGTAVLMATHSPAAISHATRVIVVSDGRVVEDRTCSKDPANPPEREIK